MTCRGAAGTPGPGHHAQATAAPAPRCVLFFCSNGLPEDCLSWAAPPQSVRVCTDTSSCDWTSAWSACMSECGPGLRTRTVWCAHGKPGVCQGLSGRAAPYFERCHNTTACRWVAGTWGACPATCGEGRQSRQVRCSGQLEQDCAHSGAKPAHVRACHATSVCTALDLWAPNCKCPAGEPTLVAAGMFNAVVGMMCSFVALFELDYQTAWPQCRNAFCGPSALLAPPAILSAVAGALAISLALERITFQEGKDTLAGSLLATGLAGLALWAMASLSNLDCPAPVEGGHHSDQEQTLVSQPARGCLWTCSKAALLTVCAIVLLGACAAR